MFTYTDQEIVLWTQLTTQGMEPRRQKEYSVSSTCSSDPSSNGTDVLDVPTVSVSAFYEVNITCVQLNPGEASSKHNNIGAHSRPSVGKIQKNS